MKFKLLLMLLCAFLISACTNIKLGNAAYRTDFPEQENLDSADIIEDEAESEEAESEETPRSEWDWWRVDCAYEEIADDANVDTKACGDPYAVIIDARNLDMAYLKYMRYDQNSEYSLFRALLKRLPKHNYTYNYNPRIISSEWFGTRYSWQSEDEVIITIQNDECNFQEDSLKFFDLGGGKVKIVSVHYPCEI